MDKGRVVVEVDLGKYRSVDLNLKEAEEFLSRVVDRLGYESNDVNETYRIIRNFEAFYETMRKKFKDHIAPAKSMNDMIRGTVIVDRVKLYTRGDEKRIVIILDRRVPEDVVVGALEDMGFKVEVKRPA
ncbi:MAG: hypothetical protein F7C08_02025 [Desulfurococcales archaeon]|nr:hypothetical protein [Desulfurococcales archaeon]MCE4605296.1 hypothetical protein [Desulfurococcales archaeon]